MADFDIIGKVTDGDTVSDGYFNAISGARDVEAGETLAAGDVVFIYGSGHAQEGEAWLADANVQDKNRANGIVIGAGGNDGDTIQIMTKGIYVTTGLTAKETYYLSATAGDWTTTSSGVKLGQAISTTELFLDIIQDDRDIVGTIKPWLQNHANMISNPLTAFWKLCDGTAISDAESPINGGEAPLLNATQRFLRGAATSDDGTDDTAGGATTSSHTHTISDRATAKTDSNGSYGIPASTTDADAPSIIPPFISVTFIMKIK